MSETLILPQNYTAILDRKRTQQAIKFLKDSFERELAKALHLDRVSAPLFVPPNSGLNDNLNGVERPVQFDVANSDETLEIVHSLAKWKRQALAEYGYTAGKGIYTDMNAIRRDETPDNLHSIYVDQWDWERVISPTERTTETLHTIVQRIWSSIKSVEWLLCNRFPEIKPELPNEIAFITSQELLDRYPTLAPKQRENAIAREKGAIFIAQIGKTLSDGTKHDGRAPDYDDWELNGDILVWYAPLQCAIELSSMGIRVDPTTLMRQLQAAHCTERASLPFHRKLRDDQLPQTIGGGIGQSRLCLVLLKKAHIGEVQASFWPESMRKTCKNAGIHLL